MSNGQNIGQFSGDMDRNEVEIDLNKFMALLQEKSELKERIRELEDINKSAGQNADVPKRFLPCLSAGLAFYMSIKRPGVDAGKITFLKQNYEELLERALTEDSERASIFFKPKLRAV